MTHNRHFKVLFDASNLRVGGGVQVAASLVDELIALSQDPEVSERFPWLEHMVFWLSPEVERNVPTGVLSGRLVRVGRTSSRDFLRRLRYGSKRPFDVHFTVFGPRYGPALGDHTVTGIADVTSVYNWPEGLPEGPLLGRIRRALRGGASRRLFAMEDFLVSESRSLLKTFSERTGFPLDRGAIIPNTLNRAVTDPLLRRDLGVKLRNSLEPDELLLGYLSRLYPHKNHSFLTELATQLRKLGVRVRFALTLSESEWESASSDLRQISVNAGVIPIDQVASFFEQCDAAIFPSLLESFSATPLEALQCNGTLFASDRPFVREVCGDLPVYIDPLDAAASARTIAATLRDANYSRAHRQAPGNMPLSSFAARDRARAFAEVLGRYSETEPSRGASLARQNRPRVSKCLLVAEHLSHYRGGVYRELQASHEVEFSFMGGPDTLGGDIPEVDVATLRDFRRARNNRLFGRLLWQPEAVRAAAREDFDVYIYVGNAAFLSTWVGAILARLRHKRVYFWTHGWKTPDSGVKRLVRNSFYSLANGLLLYGNHARAIALENGFTPDRLHVIYNSLDLPAYTEMETDVHDRSETQVWAVSSRLIPERRFDELIAKIGEMKLEGKRILLHVIGDGPERSGLQLLAEGLGVDAEFYGAVYDPESTVSILGKADILLAPQEVGLAAVHAMSAGCPVGTHSDMNRQNPEAELVVDGQTGVTAPFGNLDELCNKAWDFVATNPREEVAKACAAAIDPDWTPSGQANVIVAALRQDSHSKRNLDTRV